MVDQNTGVVLKSEINFQTNIELNRWALRQANISGMIYDDQSALIENFLCSQVSTRHSQDEIKLNLIKATENLIAPIYWTQMTNQASAAYLNFVAGKPFSHFQMIRQWPTGIVFPSIAEIIDIINKNRYGKHF